MCMQTSDRKGRGVDCRDQTKGQPKAHKEEVVNIVSHSPWVSVFTELLGKLRHVAKNMIELPKLAIANQLQLDFVHLKGRGSC